MFVSFAQSLKGDARHFFEVLKSSTRNNMSQYQVKPVQIIFDDEDIYIENLETEIENLRQMIEEIEKKCVKKESLRLICLYNSLKIQLNEKERELYAVSFWSEH